MRKSNVQPLQAISPTIDYKEFYLNYHKRKKNLLFLREKDLPQIKTNTETNNNSIDNTNTIYRTNNILNISFLSPSTSSLCGYPDNCCFRFFICIYHKQWKRRAFSFLSRPFNKKALTLRKGTSGTKQLVVPPIFTGQKPGLLLL